MQSSPYNNPMFAQGLAGLVQSFIGDPSATAANEEAASRALLNNQTAQFRDAMGQSGLEGDMAAMMIRALQAGPQYSGNAPTIGNAALGFDMMGYGQIPGGQPQMPAAPQVAGAAPQMPNTPMAAPAAPVMPQETVRPQMPTPAIPQSVALPVIPGQQTDTTFMDISILNQAREAIASGRDANAVASRLTSLGIDPARL